MADFDTQNDTTPVLTTARKGIKPTIAAMKAALTTFSASSYTADRLNAMTEDDLVYACKTHALTPVGL